MTKRLWDLYFTVFIKSPIAAILIIGILVCGLLYLVNSVSVNQYISAKGIISMVNNRVEIVAPIPDKQTEVKNGDRVTWFIKESGDRYYGTITSFETEADRSHTVRIVVSHEDWLKAQLAVTSSERNGNVEISSGKQKVKERLFYSGEVGQ
jgi:archaellum component FlaG (FlaF/FlaG flagellin family)